MRHGTQSVSEQLSRKKVNTAKYYKAESILSEYLQQEWALVLPGVCVKIVLSCVQECVKIAKEIGLEMWFD
jgi:hypothetical protein